MTYREIKKIFAPWNNAPWEQQISFIFLGSEKIEQTTLYLLEQHYGNKEVYFFDEHIVIFNKRDSNISK